MLDLFQNIAYSGQQAVVTLPSGKLIRLREANGADEEILSNNSLAATGMNLVQYIASIASKEIDGPNKHFTADEILDFRVMDLYYATLHSRVLNFGFDLKFKETCQNPNCGAEMEVEYDLSNFMGDLTESSYKPKNEFAIKKYPLEYQEVESPEYARFELFGHTFRIKYLTRKIEMATLKLADPQVNKNTPLIARELSVDSQGAFKPITFFTMFSAKQMAELRKTVATIDPSFAPYMEVECPSCRTKQLIALFNVRDFYYPGESL